VFVLEFLTIKVKLSRHLPEASTCTCKWLMLHFILAGKGKVLTRTGHEGPEGEQRYGSTLSLTPALDGGGWSTPRPGRFTPGTHCIRGCVGPRAGLDGCEKSRPHRDSIPGPSSPYRVAIPTTLYRPTLYFCKYSKRKCVPVHVMKAYEGVKL
jgi:hypothetical protein